MNAKTVTGAILIGLCLACATAQAQPEAPAPSVQPPPIRRDAPDTPLPPGSEPQTGLTGLSDWIVYHRPDCCSAGPCCPLYAEAYLRVGPSAPIGGEFLSRQLLVGWSLEGGVRALFFNEEMTAAWVIDAGIVNSNNGAVIPGTQVPLKIFQPNGVGGASLNEVKVTMQNYNRTFISLGAGREWYLLGTADFPGHKWRIGFDAGGRYGTSDMTFIEIRHRTDVIAAGYAAVHTDYEIPCGCCFLAWGLRCEWAYTWGDILQRKSDVQEITGLVTFSVRY
jgi:hypothetical protein